MRRRALIAGLAGAVTSGLPSTTWTLLRRGDVLEGARALGLAVLPNERRTVVLLAAGAPVHLALSIGWAYVLAAVLPARAEPVSGAVGGLAIAALDLGLLGRFFPTIQALPQGRQWADHVAFGVTVGAVLRATRPADRPPAPGGAAR
ncbi:MAG TPA: hypothetical protein VFZ00_21365 [Solirubrobacter sp.]|nr:hypothetical protein [Solirubrobacter sp.]